MYPPSLISPPVTRRDTVQHMTGWKSLNMVVVGVRSDSGVDHIGRRGFVIFLFRSSSGMLSSSRALEKSGRREDICACSDCDTTCGGVYRSWHLTSSGKRKRLRTLHQMGIVLLRASGIPTLTSAKSRPIEDNATHAFPGVWNR